MVRAEKAWCGFVCNVLHAGAASIAWQLAGGVAGTKKRPQSMVAVARSS